MNSNLTAKNPILGQLFKTANRGTKGKLYWQH